jgi:hypothetical protein
MAVLTSSISRFRVRVLPFIQQGSPSPPPLGSPLFQRTTDAKSPAFSGHAGAMLQARQLGDELYVGVHSDESIMENKGPTVMTLQER